MPTLQQRSYLRDLIEKEDWFKKYEEGLNLWESLQHITTLQYKKALAMMYNKDPQTEAFIKQFFIYQA